MRGYCMLKSPTTMLKKKNDSGLYDIKTEIDIKDKWPLSWQLFFAELEQIRKTSSHLYFDTDITRKTIFYVDVFIDTYFTPCVYLKLKFEIEYYFLYDNSLNNFSSLLLGRNPRPLARKLYV